MMVRWLLLLLFTPAFLHAQKIVTDKIDDFDSTRRIYSNIETLSIFGFTTVAGAVIKDQDTTIYLAFNITVGSTFELNPGDKVMFKFNDGTIYSIPYKGQHQVAFDSQTMTVLLPLSEDELNKMITSDVAKIRVNATNRDIDVDVPVKKSKRIGQLLAVVLDRVAK